jgi:hypothetical protein
MKIEHVEIQIGFGLLLEIIKYNLYKITTYINYYK